MSKCHSKLGSKDRMHFSHFTSFKTNPNKDVAQIKDVKILSFAEQADTQAGFCALKSLVVKNHEFLH